MGSPASNPGFLRFEAAMQQVKTAFRCTRGLPPLSLVGLQHLAMSASPLCEPFIQPKQTCQRQQRVSSCRRHPRDRSQGFSCCSSLMTALEPHQAAT